ncbi:unnamed protein product [Toxocara canis]|uniref:Uncharacterized protein n=1 Tax=Toxocara canis TaxID=6265 RepID=A0A183U401_TOXCA|nr:unnamed protein product [Toxocara canis]
MAQSVFASALSQCSDNGVDHCLTFSLDSNWKCKTAEVPSESRSFAGADRLFFSDPLICEGDEQLPPVALLRTDRTSAEFYATRNMAAYILQCLELLGERNPVHLLNVVFVLSHANGFQPSGVPEKFETKRDVCVISSPLLISLPYSVLDINAILSSIKQLDIERCRSLPRIVTQTVRFILFQFCIHYWRVAQPNNAVQNRSTVRGG